MSAPSLLLGSLSDWCVCYILLSSGSHFGVVLALVGAACTLPDLWYFFGWIPASALLEGYVHRKTQWLAGYMVPARSAQIQYVMGTCSYPGKYLLRLGWRGCFHRRIKGLGSAVNKEVESVHAVLVPMPVGW